MTVGASAAPAVAGGAGLGARALRPHLEGAAGIGAGDAAAAGADGGDVDHRHEHRVAADPGVARGGLVVAAVDHDADVGAGAAHVEGDEAPPAGMLRRPGAAQHAGGRPRHEGDDRHVRHHRRGRDAAVRPHDVEIARDAPLLQPVLEAAHVVAHLGADEGVHRRRGEALELAELRRDPGRGGDEGLGPFLQHDGPRALLVRGVDVGEEEADGDRLYALVAQRPRGLAHALFVERLQHVALRRHPPLLHGEAVAAAHQRARLPRDVLHDRVVLGPLVTADVDDVAVAGRGDHAGLGAVVLEHRVGRDRGAVEDVGDGVRRRAAPLAERGDARGGALRRVVRRGGHLVDRALARLAVGNDEVGEGAADIDADQLHGPSARCCGPAAARGRCAFAAERSRRRGSVLPAPKRVKRANPTAHARRAHPAYTARRHDEDEDGERTPTPLETAGLQHRDASGGVPARAAAPGLRLRRWRCRRRAHAAPERLRLRRRRPLSPPHRRRTRDRDLSTTLLGRQISMPLIVPPTGLAGLLWPERRSRLGAGGDQGRLHLLPQPRLGLQPGRAGRDRHRAPLVPDLHLQGPRAHPRDGGARSGSGATRR